MTRKIRLEPITCDDSYDVIAYKEQLSDFYYHNYDGAFEPSDFNLLKLACFCTMCGLIAHWLFWKGLLADVIPFGSAKALPYRVRILIWFASFLYMDLTSGIIHIIFDNAPHDLPLLGFMAGGFQFHHYDPTAIIRISWFEYVSHVQFMCPLIEIAVILGNASRSLHLFWLFGGMWAHLFQTAHRWVHMPPSELPWIVNAMQSCGILLVPERHMSHHEDLEHQFTILSGHTDVILDNLSLLVPPARYDLWFLLGALWFLLPFFADTIFRDSFHSASAGSKADKMKVHQY